MDLGSAGSFEVPNFGVDGSGFALRLGEQPALGTPSKLAILLVA